MVCKMVPGDNTPAVDASAMVCAGGQSTPATSGSGQEIRMALIVVRDLSTATMQVGNISISLASTVPVRSLLEHVSLLAKYQNGTFELLLQRSTDSNAVILNQHLDETLEAAGFVCDDGQTRNSLIIADLGKSPPVKSQATGKAGQDGGQSSAEKEDEQKSTYENSGDTSIAGINSGDYSSYISGFLTPKPTIGFVGLVNQAMTCYLNSLIQTLYMTPEFRNALYRWHFDGSEDEQAKSIPFQLQSLFLQLQTSDKPSIGTTNLTRSFGWDSSEAWQQHDIQELCRVMFDALEHKFKNTEQSDLISRLYEGKMVDYVRCLECRTEKAREDTFLDIPLPVRPFGSQTAYASVEEALKAFVTPETLDGNNQYWCDVCGKKCDAHKGLKFSRFPYLLTLHLKRFDFDYSTLHRIKLNDKVTFPEILSLESFLQDEQHPPDRTNNNKDSQASADTAVDQDSMSEVSESSRANSSNDTESQDDDEGIDVRAEGCTSSTSCDSSESNSNNRRNARAPSSAYNYELFSIMIHSGSASGGHYYAYIKDFTSQQWYCFNDQTVSRITYDDVRRTYGGGPSRSAGYFTSAYTSSTNAYMLMYRQMDKERNSRFMAPSEFPEHVQTLLQKMKEEEESQREVEEKEKNTCRIQLYCHHPRRGRLDLPLKLHKDVTLREATVTAYEEIGDLQGIGIPFDRCRLVRYNEFYDSVECSWDDRIDEPICEILGGIRANYKFDLLLEIIGEGQEFQVYSPGSVSIKVFHIDIETKELQTPFTVRLPVSSTVLELKQTIRSSSNISENVDNIYVVLIRYSNELRLLNQNDRTLRMDGFHRSDKIYVAVCPTSDETEFVSGGYKTRFYDLIDLYENTVTVRLTLPRTDRETLDRLGISNTPEYLSSVLSLAPRAGSPVESISPDAASEDSLSHLERERALSEGEEDEGNERRDIMEDVEEIGASVSVLTCKEDPAPEDISEGDEMDIQAKRLPNSTSSASASASEDSSLSLTDSDRTLLGDPPESEEADNLSDAGSSSNQRRNAVIQVEDSSVNTSATVKHFFKVTSTADDSDKETEKFLTVLADKRIPLSQFKAELEALLNVPAEFLLVYKKTTSTAASSFGGMEREWCQQHETLETLGDDPQVVVRLGRALRQGEVRGKIYQLSISEETEKSKFLFEWVLAPGDRVGDMKRDILAEMKTRFGIEIPYEKCFLRKKNWRTPSTVYGDDDEVFDTEMMYIFKNWEMFLQTLDLEDPKDLALNYRGADMVLFTRRWRPSTYTLERFIDVPLPTFTRAELGKKLSELSGGTVPVDHIEVAKAPGTFPCEGSLLGIHDDLTWVSVLAEDGSTTFKWPCSIQNDGDVVYWRDNNEELKKLTDAERKEILRRENGGEDPTATSSTSNYSVNTSPRKERPLRIFLDEPGSTTTATTSSTVVNKDDIELD